MSKGGPKRKYKGGRNMAVSMAVIPTLKGDAATSVLKTLESSKIKSYSQGSRIETEKKINEIIEKRTKG